MTAERLTIDDLPAARYTLFDVTREDLPAVIVVNEALLAFQHLDIFRWHLRVTIDARELAEQGMPTPEESAILFEVGDEIESIVLDGRTSLGAPNALFVARSTWNGLRELCFQIHDPEVADAALKKLIASGSHRREWDYRMTDDPAWTDASNFFTLFPMAEGWRG